MSDRVERGGKYREKGAKRKSPVKTHEVTDRVVEPFARHTEKRRLARLDGMELRGREREKDRVRERERQRE